MSLSYPTADIDTPLGVIRLSAQSDDVIYATTPSETPFVVHGVSYTVSAHLYRQDDGTFGWDDYGNARDGRNQYRYGNLHIRRHQPKDWKDYDKVSHPATERIDATLRASVAEWLADDPRVLQRGAAVDKEMKARRLDEAIAQKQSEIDDLRAQLADLFRD